MIDVVYIVIAVIAAGTGLFFLVRYLRANEDFPEIPSDPPLSPASDPTPPSTSEPVEDNISVDQKYADANRMWICKYCETINDYPAGMKRESSTAFPKEPLPVEGKSALRGDLLNKVNGARNSHPGTSGTLRCVACGKQNGDSYVL